MSLPGHGASRSVQLHAVSSERGEMEAFLLEEEEKFLVADTSCSSERRSPMTMSNLGVGKPAVAGHGRAVLGLDPPVWRNSLKFSEFQNAACTLL